MRLFFLPTLFLAMACGSQSPSSQLPGDLDNIQAPPPPAILCKQADDALVKIGARGAIDYDDQGNATVPQEIWIAMGDQHSKFAQTLALHAACTNPDGSRERKVLIRNESGVILMEAMVSTMVDMGSLGAE